MSTEFPKPKPKPIVVVNFDRVLFDTEGFIEGLKGALKPLRVTEDRWQAAYHARPDSVFRVDPFVKQLAEVTKSPAAKIRQVIDQETSDSVWYLFADVRPFLEKLRQVADLYLLCFSEPDLLNAKLDGTGLRSLFEHVVITEHLKAETRLPLPAVSQALFVNDDVREMPELARKFRWAAHVHINRYSKELPPNFPFNSFSTLAEAEPHVWQRLGLTTAV